MSMKLLLADDSITIQKVIGIIFGGDDYSLTIVDNGKAAVEKACELCPDVLLIDALMPGMTGYEVTEAVRAIPALAAKPILILTGSFEPFDEDRAKKCGADDFLAKPFDSQQIVKKVKELAELGASRAAKAVTVPPPVLTEPTEAFSFAEEAVLEPPVLIEPAEVFSFAEEATVKPPPLPSETAKSSAPADIWGAFTLDAEPSAATVAAPKPVVDTGFADSLEPDVFAIVNEESESQLVPSALITSLSPQHTGTQWIPVEEHTFEFEEENVADIPRTVFSEQAVPLQESGFGEIAFEDGEPARRLPVSTVLSIDPVSSVLIAPEPETGFFDEPVPVFEPVTSALEAAAPVFVTPVVDSVESTIPPVSVPVPSAIAAGVLSEDQLKAAISAVSKEVIERIVWEVVPDLAETLIREAIRKIKEGI
ncbi:MAG: response regulator [Desulfuromonadales bacterium]